VAGAVRAYALGVESFTGTPSSCSRTEREVLREPQIKRLDPEDAAGN